MPAGPVVTRPSTSAAASQMEPKAAADQAADDSAELGVRGLRTNQAAERQQSGGATCDLPEIGILAHVCSTSEVDTQRSPTPITKPVHPAAACVGRQAPIIAACHLISPARTNLARSLS